MNSTSKKFLDQNKRSIIITAGIVLAMLASALVYIPAAYQQITTSTSTTSSTTSTSTTSTPGTTIACFFFTIDGKPVGERICNETANDLHITFKGKCKVQFTNDGEDVGKPKSCASGANDFTVEWNPATGAITGFKWTKNGNVLVSENVPASANDFHFETKDIVIVVWTVDGKKLGDPIPAPPGANDLEYDLVVLPSSI